MLSSGLYIFASSASWPGVTVGHCPHSPWLIVSRPKTTDWRLTPARLPISAVSCVYMNSQCPHIRVVTHAVFLLTQVHPKIILFTQLEHTALSRVNMQQYVVNKTKLPPCIFKASVCDGLCRWHSASGKYKFSWRSKDKLISDVLLWTPSHGRAKTGWLARNYIQQLCADTGYSLEDLPGAMDDRDGWWERVREIYASSVTWWWWWYSKLFYQL